MRWLAAVLAASLAVTLPGGAVQGARDTAPPAAAAASPYELLVFEVDDCAYCELFRRDVLPLYKSSETARTVPIRFVNVSRSDESTLRLTYAITIAPTIVLMMNGKEVDRITGYTGHETFLKYVNYMLGKGD